MTDQRQADPKPHDESSRPALALQQFDIGAVNIVRQVSVGSSHSRKWVVSAASGEYVLKERVLRPGSLEDLAIVHAVQQNIASTGLPVARLIKLRDHEATWIVHDRFVYELTALVRGNAFSKHTREAYFAGQTLARWHSLGPDDRIAAKRVHPFHDRTEMTHAVCNLRPESQVIARSLIERYESAAQRINRAGYPQWPAVTLHGDWHPGNMIFAPDATVTGIFDLDSMYLQPRSADVANGALQFSLSLPPGDEGTISGGLHETLLLSFLTGYESWDDRSTLSRAEIDVLPDLMIEALIAETLSGLAQQGRMGIHDCASLLPQIGRKASWIDRHGPDVLAQLG